MLEILIQLIPTLICIALSLLVVHLCQLISKQSKKPVTRTYPPVRPRAPRRLLSADCNPYKKLPLDNQNFNKQKPAKSPAPQIDPPQEVEVKSNARAFKTMPSAYWLRNNPPEVTPPPAPPISKEPFPLPVEPTIPTEPPITPTTPQKPSISIPDSINSDSLRELAAAKKPPIAINRGVPYKILTLLQSDRATADRLFAKVSTLNPGKPEKWCWDKVQWDLERDRY